VVEVIGVDPRGLEISQAAGKWVDRNDVAITGGCQCGEAEIQHAPGFLRAASLDNEIGEGARAQFPDQAISRCEDTREVQIHHDGALKPTKSNASRRVDRMPHNPSQGSKGQDITAAAEYNY
jgi:hypothetical protein